MFVTVPLHSEAVSTDTTVMQSDDILDLLRPLVIVVDLAGKITRADGGYGGFLGHDRAALLGASVFDFVPPDQHDELATYFVQSLGEEIETVSLPVPFRMNAIGADGLVHPVDVIPSARFEPTDSGADHTNWVVTLMPVALNTSLSRALDAETSGRPRSEVRSLLTEELTTDNDLFTTRWFLVEFDAERPVTTSRSIDEPVTAAITAAIHNDGWTPWSGAEPRSCLPIDVRDLSGPLRHELDLRDWRRAFVAPVHVDDECIAAYLMLGSVPANYKVMVVASNIEARVRSLVDLTGMIFSRWRDRDQLTVAATSDSLTGLANRQVFADALDCLAYDSTLLFIDIDDFKSVNDRFGHEAGDRVLIEVSNRISAVCRPGDVVSRFGGDEFVVLLNGVGPTDGREIGDRILESVAKPLQLGARTGPECVRVSVGMAATADHPTARDALHSADRAMMREKRHGRRASSSDGTKRLPE